MYLFLGVGKESGLEIADSNNYIDVGSITSKVLNVSEHQNSTNSAKIIHNLKIVLNIVN